MKIRKYAMSLEHLPVDLFADPDGDWDYDTLVSQAGYDPDAESPPLIGALTEPWFGHPEGAAVVAGSSDGDAPVIAVVECAGRDRHRAA